MACCTDLARATAGLFLGRSYVAFQAMARLAALVGRASHTPRRWASPHNSGRPPMVVRPGYPALIKSNMRRVRFRGGEIEPPVNQCAKGCRWVLELVGRGRPWLCAAAAGLRRAAATWGVPHTPEGLAGGVACDEELPESGSWLYKLIHNDNLKRLTLLMMRL
jgi:hypothetical protein